MYKRNKPAKTTLIHNKSYIAEPIEMYADRIMNNKEPIKNASPLIYTDREEGVLSEFDVRTDKFEEIVGAFDKMQASQLAKRQEKIDLRNKKDGGAESGDGTSGTPQK